jgi:hypothetical protein
MSYQNFGTEEWADIGLESRTYFVRAPSSSCERPITRYKFAESPSFDVRARIERSTTAVALLMWPDNATRKLILGVEET